MAKSLVHLKTEQTLSEGRIEPDEQAVAHSFVCPLAPSTLDEASTQREGMRLDKIRSISSSVVLSTVARKPASGLHVLALRAPSPFREITSTSACFHCRHARTTRCRTEAPLDFQIENETPTRQYPHHSECTIPVAPSDELATVRVAHPSRIEQLAFSETDQDALSPLIESLFRGTPLQTVEWNSNDEQALPSHRWSRCSHASSSPDHNVHQQTTTRTRRDVAALSELKQPGQVWLEMPIDLHGERLGTLVLGMHASAANQQDPWADVKASMQRISDAVVFLATMRREREQRRRTESTLRATQMALALFAIESGEGPSGVGTSAWEASVRRAARLHALGTRITRVAHDIAGPVSSIRVNLLAAKQELTHMAEQGTHLPEMSDLFADMELALERVREIMTDLRLQARSESTTPETVDVESVIESTLRLMRHDIEARATLKRSFAGCGKARIKATHLSQVLVNLLTNAVQALPMGMPSQQAIVVTTSSTPSWIKVSIRDTGSGIPEALQGDLFRKVCTTKPPELGTGIGLQICAQIIANAGGEIRLVESTERGTEFEIALPRGDGELARTLTSTTQPVT